MPRDRLIQVKVSEDEKQVLREKAARMGVQPSQYLRAVGLQFEFGEKSTPVPYETQHDRENKAKVRQVVEDEEPYEVKIEPAVEDEMREKVRINQERTWIDRRATQLKARMSTRNAEAQAQKEWDER